MASRRTDYTRVTANDRALVRAALDARAFAHAPWSQFKVGAAAKFGGKFVKGCNVEFDVYGLTNCAERTAIFAAFASGAARQPMTAIAIVTDTPHAASPCGACRQVMFECGGADLRVILSNVRGEVRVARMGDLLPGGFELEPLAKRTASRKMTARRKR